MALTEELPIYRATYRLLNMLLRATQDFPRFYKYSLGTRMVELNLDMLSLIYKANSSYASDLQAGQKFEDKEQQSLRYSIVLRINRI